MLKKQIYIFNVDTLFKEPLLPVDTQALQAIFSKLSQHQLVFLSQTKKEADVRQLFLSGLLNTDNARFVTEQILNNNDITTKIIMPYNLDNQNDVIDLAQYMKRAVLVDTSDKSNLVQKAQDAGCKVVVFQDWARLNQDIQTALTLYSSTLAVDEKRASATNRNSFWRQHDGKITLITSAASTVMGGVSGYLVNHFSPITAGYGVVVDVSIGSAIGAVLAFAPLGIAFLVTECSVKSISVRYVPKTPAGSLMGGRQDDDEIPLLDKNPGKNDGSVSSATYGSAVFQV